MNRDAARRLVLVSSSALFLELLLIRWIGGEAPVLGYFKNFPLLAAFLGMGVGARLARASGDLSPLAPVSLGALGLCLSASGPLGLGLENINLTDPNLPIWGFIGLRRTVVPGLFVGLMLLGLMALGFVALGHAVGRLLDDAGPRLASYGLDLLGGLVGVLAAMGALSLGTRPAFLFPVGLLVFGFSAHPEDLAHEAAARRSKLVRRTSLAFSILIPLVDLQVSARHDVSWSPYYRIEISPYVFKGVRLGESLSVNRDVHQFLLDLSDRQLAEHPSQASGYRSQYAFPYLASGADVEGKRIVVAGAGTGNDVAEALRRSPSQVVAVELDPTIARIGRLRHPEQPYASPRVELVNDDARAAFRRLRGADFDILVYGLLDTHSSLAAFGSLRLEDFVYTVEGIQAGLGTLGPRGVALMSFYEGSRRWLGDRLASVVTRASGEPPVVARSPGQGVVHLLFGPGLDRTGVRSRLSGMNMTDEAAARLADGIRPTTDDWPFLYASPRGLPVVYASALLVLVLLTLIAIWGASRMAARKQNQTVARREAARDHDAEMAILGAAFLLVETKAITEMARLFGVTWIVTALVLASIFVVLVVANLVATVLPKHLAPLFGLGAALGLILPHVLPMDLDSLAPLGRALMAAAVVGLPIGLGGISFSCAFARIEPGRGGRALGANLAGAAVGGGLEALSLVFGLRALAVIGATLYLTWATIHSLSLRGSLQKAPGPDAEAYGQ